MANEGNLVISHIRAQMKSAHWLLEETIADVSDEMARFAPPGKALPIGAAYVHYVTSEDWAVYDATDGYLAALADSELSREVDLSAMGLGKQTVGFVLDNALLGHAYCHCGEISALKGVQGKKGYPF